MEKQTKLDLQNKRRGAKIIIGVLFMFIPIINLFAFGYAYRFLKIAIQKEGECALPNWNHWTHLFFDGLRLLILLMSCVVTALGISCVVQWALFFASMTLIHLPWYHLFPAAFVLLMPIFLALLVMYQTGGSVRSLCNVPLLRQFLRRIWLPMLPISLAFIGVQIVCQALYGVAWFIGLLMLFYHLSQVLQSHAKIRRG